MCQFIDRIEETMTSSGNSTPSLPTPKLKDFAFNEKLGSGTYGEVYKVYKKVGAREVFAVKCVSRSKLKQVEVDAIVTEISLLKKLKHPNIVQMEDFAWDSNYIYIIMEYCGHGDLSKYIRAHRRLPESVCRRFLQQLAVALQYLRSQDIAHLDLKPQNILLQGGILKLADFGFAQKLSPDQTKTAIRGSPLYMAPEMVLDRKYDAKVDLWSVGVILYECLFGRAPYKSDSLDELLIKVKSETPIVIPNSCQISDHCQDLLAHCLQRDPTKRISFEDFFQHPFLDLEHVPSESSYDKASALLEKAVGLDRDGNLDDALVMYRAALEYLVPLLQWEKNQSKKSSLKDKIDRYISRAEEIKRISCQGSSGSVAPQPTLLKIIERRNERPQSLTSLYNPRLDELLKLSAATPALKTALEIAQSAEFYEKEAQYSTAIERYQKSLGLLLPLLSSEPKGPRKTLLASQVHHWMGRAEEVKELMKIQEKVLADSSSDSVNDKQCIVQ